MAAFPQYTLHITIRILAEEPDSFIHGFFVVRVIGWVDLPERSGSPKTVSSRLYLYPWRKADVWDKVLAELQRMGDTLGEV